MTKLKVFKRMLPVGVGLFCLISLLGQIISGCASPPVRHTAEERQDLVWPPPPEQPRISYVRDIVFPRDIRRESGVWDRIKELITGRTRREMVRPYGLTLDADENLLIADPGAHVVHIYHLPDGTYRHLPHRKDPVVLLSPIDLDVDGDGRIYITDSAAGKVYVFNHEGRYETSLGDFQRPTGLAVNQSLQRVYVIDTRGQSIRVYRTSGKHLFDFGERGTGQKEFNYPTHISLDQKGRVYVMDSMNFRVQVFDPEGNFLRVFGRAGDGPGNFSKPKGIGVDQEGHVYVADATFDNVQIFTAEGKMLLYFGAPGEAAGMFSMPAGIAIDEGNRIFVSDSFNRRIQVFQFFHEDEMQDTKE
jgi:DNA-binding beta-propeller fold protein YncE